MEVHNLVKRFPVSGGGFLKKKRWLNAVNGVSFTIERGEVFSLVGESGCGKSTTARTIARLYEPDEGAVLFDGKDISHLESGVLRPFRKRMQMVFQNPYSSLNPRHTVSRIITDPLLFHGIAGGKKEARDMALRYLEKVGISSQQADRYPHQFSGGQRQRISIARSLALGPELLIADEPVSALDVSIQAQILNLLLDLREEFGMAYLFIAHDLSVVRHVSDYVGIMYRGKIVEHGRVDHIFSSPVHPYTNALLESVPVLGRKGMDHVELSGEVVSAPLDGAVECVFAHRCPFAAERCIKETPILEEIQSGHWSACFYRK